MRAWCLIAVSALVSLATIDSAAIALPLVRLAQADASHRVLARFAPDTSDYIRATAMGDNFDVQAGKVAQAKTRSDDVQRFAQMMVAEHASASDGLSAILRQNAFAFTLPATLDDEHTAMVRELDDSQRADFDRRYMQQQIDALQSALRVQGAYAHGGRDLLLRRFAAESVPKIRAQLELAGQTVARMNRVALRLR